MTIAALSSDVQVKQVLVPQAVAKTETATPLNKTTGQKVVDTAPTQLTPKQKLIQDIAQDQLGEFLDVKVKPDGTLEIIANDKEFGFFDNMHTERSMGSIRSRLGLKEGVIGKHNPEVYDRYSSDIQRNYGSTPDDGILAPGSSITIPANEVGKNPHIFQALFGTFDDLKK